MICRTLLRCVGVGRAKPAAVGGPVQMTRVSSVNAAATRRRGRASIAEFIVPSTHVLHERVAAHDHAGAAITLEATHRSQPRLEPPMVRLNPIVRVLLGVVERAREELLDDREECPGPIGHDFRRLAVATERGREEPSRGRECRAERRRRRR